jgi:hypothetical protein
LDGHEVEIDHLLRHEANRRRGLDRDDEGIGQLHGQVANHDAHGLLHRRVGGRLHERRRSSSEVSYDLDHG